MIDYENILEALKIAKVDTVYRNEALRGHCSWCIGGNADILVEPCCVSDLKLILQLTREYGIPVVIIGQGSNLLFDDEGVRGVVIRICERMSSYSIEGTRVKAQAGVWMPRLSRAVGNMGLTGLEHTIGIPGTLGGLIVMNGGSQHKCIGDVVQEVNVLDSEGQTRSFSREECKFSYRSSAMQKSGLIVTDVKLEVRRGNIEMIRRKMLELLRERSEKFPRKTPSCGSVFVSSKEMHESFGPPGRVIEETGLKGLRVGGAQVSHKHANFIINLGEATSADVLELISSVRQAVYNRTGIWMKCEVRYVSPEGQILPAHQI